MRGEKSIYFWNWRTAAAVFIAALLVLQFIRANRPERKAVDAPAAFRYTTGTIVDAPVTVPPRDFVSYKIDLNRRTDLRGEFTTGDNKVRIECLLLDAANFEAWKTRADNRSISATGNVPGGKIVRVIPPGTYYIVVSNRDAADADAEKTVYVKFTAE